MPKKREKWDKAIQARIAQSKMRVLEEFRKMPILQIALERAGVKSRSTYYEWRDKDEGFREAVDKAITVGEALITDMSESQLISMIRDKHFSAVQLWLRQHHPKYAAKLEVTASVVEKRAEMTPEEKEAFEKAVLDAIGKAPLVAGGRPPPEERSETEDSEKNQLINNQNHGTNSK